jgi:hypothetical protein
MELSIPLIVVGLAILLVMIVLIRTIRVIRWRWWTCGRRPARVTGRT